MAIIISKGGRDAKKVAEAKIKDEDWLQNYVCDNPECLALDEIKDGLQLLVISREFPVGSGAIDALALDGDGDLYIIETKLFKNPDKRKVVSQVLDYGASLWRNSTDYELFINLVEERVSSRYGVGFNEKLKEYFGLSDEDLNGIKTNVRRNLRDGSFYFIILMDEVYKELKDLIAFMNKNSSFNIYSVELNFYRHEGNEILVPRVYGAEIKKEISQPTSERGRWDEKSFFELAEGQLDESGLKAVTQLYHFSIEKADEIKFGTGVKQGSFSPRFYGLSPKSLFNVLTDGRLWISLYGLAEGGKSEELQSEYNENLKAVFGGKIKGSWPELKISEWASNVDQFIKIIENFIGR